MAAGAPLNAAWQSGKQGLRAVHREQVLCRESRSLTGSVDVDAAFATAEPHAPRWDYGLGFKTRKNGERAIWIEIHPASTGEVAIVLKKLDWMRGKIQSCSALAKITNVDSRDPPPYVWLATGSVRISRNSAEARKLLKAGLDFPRSVLPLD